MMVPSNDLSGAGVLIRTIEKGDGTTFPANGDSCLVRNDAILLCGQRDRRSLHQTIDRLELTLSCLFFYP
jgi:hypothetical protein